MVKYNSLNNLKMAAHLFLFLLLFSCSGNSDQENEAGREPSVKIPPLPPPEDSPVSMYGEGFEELFETGIDFQIAFLSPTPNTTGKLFFQHPEIFAGGAAAADFDRDGDIDVFVVRGDIGGNILYENDGTGVFIDVAEAAGLAFTRTATENYRHSGPTFADMDGDGDLDLFLGGLEGDPSMVFQNDGNGNYSDVTNGSGLDTMNVKYTIGSSFADYDRDGDLDLFLTHWGNPIDVENPYDSGHLWRNDSENGQILYSDVSIQSRVTEAVLMQPTVPSVLGEDHDATFTAVFADINSDSYPDILIASDFNSSRILVNDTHGAFIDATDETVIIDDSGMGAAVGDFDNDGDLDWFVSAIHGAAWPVGNRLYQNDSGVFSDVGTKSGVNQNVGTSQQQASFGWGACAADLDLDGNLDIYLNNGFPYSLSLNNGGLDFNFDTTRVYMGNGDNTFTDRASELKLRDRRSSRMALCADFDNDGDLDILQLHREEENAATFYRNNINQNNYIAVVLTAPGTKNIDAIGARVCVTSGSKTQMREIVSGSSYTTQNPVEQIFGLGQLGAVDSIRVLWPDGTETIQRDPEVNNKYVVSKP